MPPNSHPYQDDLDLDARIRRAQEAAKAEEEIRGLANNLRRYHLSTGYTWLTGSITTAALIGWFILAILAVATEGVGIGRPVGILLAASAVLTLVGAMMGIGFWLDYRIHAREADRDLFWEHLYAQAIDELSKAIQKGTEERLQEILNAGFWRGAAETLRDIYGDNDNDRKILNMPRIGSMDGSSGNGFRSPASR